MEVVQFIMHMSRSCNRTMITDEQRQPVEILEKTLSDYFHIFKQSYFQTRKPKSQDGAYQF